MIRLLEEDYNNDLASLISSILGTIISVGLNLTPLILFYEYFKGKREFKNIPEMMFISGTFCCSTNLAYAILKGDTMLIISNSICDILQVLYATVYLFIFAEKKILQYLLYLIIAYDLTFEVIYIFADLLKFHTNREYALEITGYVNIGISVINAITPGQNIIKVFKTEDFTLLPIVTICFQCLCSSFWGFYGFKDMDNYVIIPNLLGVSLTLFQIIVYFYYRIKRKGVPPNANKEKEEERENDEEKDENDEENGDNGKKEEMEKKGDEIQENLIDK